MGDDDDRPSWVEREKKSFSELDRMRRERRSEGERAPRSASARARTGRATKQYLKQIDGLFSSGKGGSEGEELTRAMLEARGTAGLADACRAYREALGFPSEAREISCFLDSGDSELVLGALEALGAAREAEALELSAGLRSQLRMLAQAPDDAVAEAAEELLETL